VSLETEFHEFVALAADVRGGEVGFCLTVGGRDDIGLDTNQLGIYSTVRGNLQACRLRIGEFLCTRLLQGLGT
jgi:hypothetical protein